MSIVVDGFASSAFLAQIDEHFKTLSEAERKEQVAKVKGVFQFNVKNKAGKVESWTLDLKNGTGSIAKGAPKKADITIDISDQDFVDLAQGKANGQKLFMSGKIKAKGAVMLATKLDGVLKAASAPKAKL
ncbi:hypothetical protein BGZ75_006281 [Mortierella antarctica]|nr:hypothetical protein BGZ67_002802 [Mortierella alpina]KAF9982307.1 hypothetical protein BGZ75_006281 [Mortierella antarctica]